MSLDHLIAGVVTIVAIVTAAFVEVNGGDPNPYILVAGSGGGYAAGSIVAKRK